MVEVWKVIPAWPEYAVSSLGRVKRILPGINTSVGRVLRLSKSNGYLYATLCRGSVARRMFVAKLMLEAFVGPRPAGYQTRHLDGNRTNNTIQNLRWGTTTENGMDRRLHGTQKGTNHHKAILTEEIVAEVRKRFKKRCLVNGAKAMAKEFGVSHHAMEKAIRGEAWFHVE